jgi:uncharacterized protein (DUF4415 family)
MSEANITRRSANDRRQGKTDWAKLESQSDADIEANVASDPDAAPLLDDAWFAEAELTNRTKKAINIRLDQDVVEYFQRGGKNYQTRINNVLKAYVDARTKALKGA